MMGSTRPQQRIRAHPSCAPRRTRRRNNFSFSTGQSSQRRDASVPGYANEARMELDRDALSFGNR
jgi:hypothetical protein